MDNCIILDGKMIPLEEYMSEETINVIRADQKDKEKKRLFERVKSDSTYFYINDCGTVEEDFSAYLEDEWRHKVANYCADKALMMQRALHETLNRLLWRFSMENGEGENPWDGRNIHYELCYSAENKNLYTYPMRVYKVPGVIYFPSQQLAQRAIDEIIKPFMKEYPDFVL